MRKRIISALLVTVMTFSMLVGCSDKSNDSEEKDSNSASKQSEETNNTEDEVTLTLFSNLPDRKNGQGLVEQKLIDEYMAENPNVTIEVEALDEEAYKIKFKAYAMDGMPDIVNIWGQPSFLDEVLDAGVLAKLDESDYADYKFVSGSLDGFKKDGELYGLPRNSDVMGFFYNKEMFAENGWTVPDTYEDFMTLCKDITDKGLIPIAMDGGDGWPLAIYYDDLLFRIAGADRRELISNAISTGDFSDEAFTKAAQLLIDSANAGMFQTGYDSQDYGTAMNLFTNGQAAMFYTGSWESSMALNEDISEDIRTNMGAFLMPEVADGKGKLTDIMSWNGGGYAVSENSENKEEAIKFLNFMYQPDKLSKYGWENGVGMSAQDQTDYMSGNETSLQLEWLDFLNGATSTSGTPVNDCGPSTFKTAIESQIQSLSNGTMSIEDFVDSLGKACK